ncbi:hypothetical protein BH20ACT2_BH20ACT2_23230 [soil metagenome]
MSATGAIYDRGYRPYEGPRGGRRAAVLALWRASVRRALGLRRSWRQKLFPWALLVIATVPAIVNVGVAYLTRDTSAADIEFITYRDYVGISTALLVFVALTAPDVLCPDRRQRVLPVIFARPLTGADYVWAKFSAIASIVFAFGFLPHVVLFVGQMLVSDAALTYLGDNADVLWKVPASVAIVAVYYAAIGLAAAALTDRRIVAAAGLLTFTLVSSAVAGIFTSGGDSSPVALANLLGLPLYLRDLVFLGHISIESALSGVEGGGSLAVLTYVVVVGGCLAILLRRYRWIER